MKAIEENNRLVNERLEAIQRIQQTENRRLMGAVCDLQSLVESKTATSGEVGCRWGCSRSL